MMEINNIDVLDRVVQENDDGEEEASHHDNSVETNTNSIYRDYFHVFRIIFYCTVNLIPIMWSFSCTNFIQSVLSLVVILLVLNSTRKRAAEILLKVIAGYCILVMLLKVVTVVIWVYYQSVLFTQDNTNILIDLGLIYSEHNEFEKWFQTFFPEGISIIAYFGLQIFREIDSDCLDRVKQSFVSSNYKVNLFIFVFVLLISGFNCVNSSFVSIIYALVLILILVLWSFKRHKGALKFLYILTGTVSMLHIVSCHICNIYSMRELYLKDNFYIVNWAGVTRMHHWYCVTDYVLSVLIYIFSLVGVYIRKRCILLVENGEMIQEEEDTKKNRFWKLIGLLVKWISSPFFTLHFCRFAVLLWVYLYPSYPSFLLMLWYHL